MSNKSFERKLAVSPSAGAAKSASADISTADETPVQADHVEVPVASLVSRRSPSVIAMGHGPDRDRL
jgi:hypothetical protein